MAMPIDILFDFAAVHVDKAAEVEVRIDFVSPISARRGPSG
jgi:hypothetical protein